MKKSLYIMLLIFVYYPGNNTLLAQIELIATIPGVPAQDFMYNSFSWGVGRGLLDFTGDAKPDLTLMEEEGIYYYLKIVDGDDPNRNWKIPLPDGIIAVLIGFYNLTEGTYKPGDGVTFNLKEIIVAERKGNKYINPIIIRSDDNYETVEMESFGTNVVCVAAGDVNGDGIADIMIFDPDVKEVQIWGYK